MGILDRFRSAGKPTVNGSKAGLSDQEATRLIEEGHTLEAKGMLDEALQCYLNAIPLATNPARAHLNHGNILLLKGNLQGALNAFSTALKYKPDYAGAFYNIGNALLGNGQIDEAVENYRLALDIQPDYAEVHCSLGIALRNLGQMDSAIASFRSALEHKPDLVEAQTNLGSILGDLHNAGNVLLGAGKFDDAITAFQRVLEIEPNLAEAHFNLGNALRIIGRLDSAASSYLRAVEIKPGFIEALNNAGMALQELGQLDDALANYRRVLDINPGYIDTLDNLILALNYTASFPPAYYLEQARRFGQVASKNANPRFSRWLCATQPQRLRVGLVSGDFHLHSVGHFLEGLLAHIDRARIELIAYPTNNHQDELTVRIRPFFSVWNPLAGLSDENAARTIHADGVHILIDLSGHTDHNRLPVFAWKPAPVQMTWLGLPATSGVAEIDYVLGDSYAIPAEHERHFSEAVWRMPDIYLCLAIPRSPLNIVPPPALAAGYVTFGSFNNLTKMNDTVVAAWAKVLKAVPNSRLMLKAGQLKYPAVREATRQRFASFGIAPERLIVSGMLASRDDHLAAYNKVDIALDTFPYPGVTTSVEALWMGVPVLSKQGDRFLSRTAGSIAHNAGLSDWIAVDEEDYIARAVAFASDLECLASLRAGLRQQVLASPLFDAQRFARNFEDALWGMWSKQQTWGRGG